MDHVSIFNPKTKLPKAVRDFGNIPYHYMDWFNEIFEKGKRSVPPATAGAPGAVKAKFIVITSTGNFEIKLLREFKSAVLSHRCILR